MRASGGHESYDSSRVQITPESTGGGPMVAHAFLALGAGPRPSPLVINVRPAGVSVAPRSPPQAPGPPQSPEGEPGPPRHSAGAGIPGAAAPDAPARAVLTSQGVAPPQASPIAEAEHPAAGAPPCAPAHRAGRKLPGVVSAIPALQDCAWLLSDTLPPPRC